jgi:DNA-binding NarL/FixJ family response regulator
MNTGPIWLIDADIDDRDFVEYIWKDLQLPNELKFFRGTQDLFQELDTVSTMPFIIISDVRLENEDGFEMRRKMLQQHSKRFESVPFIFWSTTASDMHVIKAYELSIHGFFLKDMSVHDLKNTFISIITYWTKSLTPPKQTERLPGV